MAARARDHYSRRINCQRDDLAPYVRWRRDLKNGASCSLTPPLLRLRQGKSRGKLRGYQTQRFVLQRGHARFFEQLADPCSSVVHVSPSQGVIMRILTIGVFLAAASILSVAQAQTPLISAPSGTKTLAATLKVYAFPVPARAPHSNRRTKRSATTGG